MTIQTASWLFLALLAILIIAPMLSYAFFKMLGL